MSCINANRFGAAEQCACDNWAAEYAKKLFEKEQQKDTEQNSAISVLETHIGDTDTLKTSAKSSLSAAVNEIYNSLQSEKAQRTAGDNNIQEALNNKVNNTDYATSSSYGVIKLGGGLYTYSNGTTGVYPKNGIRVSGDGAVIIDAATADEAAAGTNVYKPITPSTLKSVTGDMTSLTTTAKDSITNAINEVIVKTGANITLPELKSFGRPYSSGNHGFVMRNIINVINDINTDNIAIRRFDLANMVRLAVGGGMHISNASGYTKPFGIYFFVPDIDISRVSINNPAGQTASLEYAYSNGRGKFLKDNCYIIQLDTESKVLYDPLIHSGNKIYSDKPHRVGEWIDGTPIWRFTVPITSLQSLGITTHNKAWMLKVSNLIYELYNISDEYIIYIDDKLIFQNTNDYKFDSFATGISCDNNGIYCGSAEDVDNATHVYGWIEAAVSEEHVNTE